MKACARLRLRVTTAIESHSGVDDEVAKLHEPSGDAATSGITTTTRKPRKPARISFSQERVSTLARGRPRVGVHVISPPFHSKLEAASRVCERSGINEETSALRRPRLSR